MTKAIHAIVVGTVLLLAGCSRMFCNRSHLMDTVATLPSGDQITAEAEEEMCFGAPDKVETYVIWKRTGKETRLTELRQSGWYLPNKQDLQTHVSGDGNLVWMTRDGVTCASFDYEKAVAIFGEKGQPKWASGSTQ